MACTAAPRASSAGCRPCSEDRGTDAAGELAPLADLARDRVEDPLLRRLARDEHGHAPQRRLLGDQLSQRTFLGGALSALTLAPALSARAPNAPRPRAG